MLIVGCFCLFVFLGICVFLFDYVFVFVSGAVLWTVGRCFNDSLQAIQSSLSSSSLANNPSSYATETSGQTINKKEVGMIVQLKRELEEKEKFTQRWGDTQEKSHCCGEILWKITTRVGLVLERAKVVKIGNLPSLPSQDGAVKVIMSRCHTQLTPQFSGWKSNCRTRTTKAARSPRLVAKGSRISKHSWLRRWRRSKWRRNRWRRRAPTGES